MASSEAPAPGDRPLVTVVSISFNDLRGLARTRLSVIRQSYRRIEHIVVDGGSTDGTVEWLRLEEDLQWVSESDGGRYHAMNKGAGLASGQLLWFMHAGDVFGSPDAVSTVVTSWLSEGWRWAYGAARLVQEDGEVRGVNAPLPFNLRRFSLGDVVLPHQATCFETEFFRELGAYDEAFGVAADQLFMLRAALKSRPTTIAEFLCDFDSGGAGSRRSPFRHYYDSARARRRTGAVLCGPVVDGAVFLTLAGLATGRRQIARRMRR